MADYDLSKAGNGGSAAGKLGLIAAGAIVVLVLIFALTSGGGAPIDPNADPGTAPLAEPAAPAADPVITE